MHQNCEEELLDKVFPRGKHSSMHAGGPKGDINVIESRSTQATTSHASEDETQEMDLPTHTWSCKKPPCICTVWLRMARPVKAVRKTTVFGHIVPSPGAT